MDVVLSFLVDWGYWGMLVAAFLAGSFLPFNSEAVMVGLQAAGLDPLPLVVYGTIGNALGSLFNYGVGRMGKVEWIERYLHVRKESLDKARRFVGEKGAWMGFFCFIPLLGSAIAILLGLMKANFALCSLTITLGKLARYLVIVYGVVLLRTWFGF